MLVPDKREDVRAFVAKLPGAGQDARAEVKRRIYAELEHRSETLFAEMKRIRDDTFHYARDERSQERLRTAMELAADEDGRYFASDRRLHAEYADVITTRLIHPFPGEEAELKKHPGGRGFESP